MIRTIPANFQKQIATWKNSTIETLDKILLLFQKFFQVDYQRFADAILPKKQSELILAEAIKILTGMFGYREIKFAYCNLSIFAT